MRSPAFFDPRLGTACWLRALVTCAVAAGAPAAAGAAECEPAAMIVGDRDSAAEVAGALARLGIGAVVADSACAPLLASVERDAGGLVVSIRTGDRVERRVVADAAVAATWIESWVRDDGDADTPWRSAADEPTRERSTMTHGARVSTVARGLSGSSAADAAAAASRRGPDPSTCSDRPALPCAGPEPGSRVDARHAARHRPGVTAEAPGPPLKKHRHDLGHEDHGPVMAERTTRGIQMILGLWIALTAGALLWAAIDAGRGAPQTPAASTSAR